MSRFAHLTLALGTMVLLTILLVFAVGAQPAVTAAGDTIKVPDDYPTIQGAIDAATDGDEIRVAFGTYPENLSITKGITLSGSWSADFTHRTGRSVIDGQGLGRVISITCVTSDTVVTVDGFVVENGDATGKGAPTTQVGTPRPPASLLKSDIPQTAPDADPRSPIEQMAELKAHLADVAARGLYPGGEDAYQTMLAQLDWLTAQAVAAHVRANALRIAAPDDPPQAYDFGGGIFSHNASLHLLNNIIRNNTASRKNNGVGGGVYVGQAAPGGVIISNNVVHSNVASAGNVYEVLGMGGGLYMDHAPGAVVKENEFDGNHGAEAGLDSSGLGGAIMIWSSPAPDVNFNIFERNTANLAWDGSAGVGGAMYLRRVNGAVVHDNAFNGNLAALRGGGSGGGLFLSDSEDVFVAKNSLDSNIACLYQNTGGALGGGIALIRVNDSTIDFNDLLGNTACVNCMRTGETPNRGGGLYGEQLADIKLTTNSFRWNIGAQTSQARGGGVYILGSSATVLSENLFEENVAATSYGYGAGGGLCLEGTTGSEIRGNVFLRNRGGTVSASSGGGLALSVSVQPNMNATVEANSFVGNLAAASPNDGNGGAFMDYVTQGLTFRNNVVARNVAGEAGGIKLIATGQGQVINNTLVGNTDSGVLVSSASVELINNIVVSHTVGISVTKEATATVSYTLWDGNDTDIGGGGTISHTHPVNGDPAFFDPSNDDYHLAVGSPAIDAGDPAGVPPAPDHDYDGVDRPQGMAVDIGAYEWQGHYQYLPLVMNKRRPVVGWAAGHTVDGYGVIIHTTNGGETWVRQGAAGEIPNANLAGVTAIDTNNAWVVGEQGTILRTRNGGLTWQQQEVPTEASAADLCGVYAVDHNTAWAAGAYATDSPGIILHTTDGGHTWTRQGQDLELTAQLCGVYASNEDHAWVVGGDEPPNSYGTILRTADAGETWERVPYTPPDNIGGWLISVHGHDASPIWAVGNSQAMRSVDGGVTWDDRTPGVGLFDVNGVYVVDHNSLWVVVDDGGIYRSDDSGEHWMKQTVPPGTTGDYILRISAIDKQTAWAVTAPDPTDPMAPGHVLHTADGGQTWITQTTPVSPPFWGVSFVDARR